MGFAVGMVQGQEVALSHTGADSMLPCNCGKFMT